MDRVAAYEAVDGGSTPSLDAKILLDFISNL